MLYSFINKLATIYGYLIDVEFFLFFLIVYIGENYKFPDCDIYIFVPKSELLHLSNDPHTPKLKFEHLKV